MNIAVVTGASSGIGKALAMEIDKKYTLDEIWVLARDKKALEALDLCIKTPIRVLDCDLAAREGIEKYKSALNDVRPTVRILVNAAGFGKFGKHDEIPLVDTLGMIDLNARALVEMTLVTLPYIPGGGAIVQMASLSSFQPVPYLNVYGASKAFVLSFSRALGVELRERKIRVIAVAPGWVRTPFLDKAEQTSRTAVTFMDKIYLPEQVAVKALRDLERGRALSILGFRVRAQVLLVKLLPHNLVMRIWMRQQKHK